VGAVLNSTARIPVADPEKGLAATSGLPIIGGCATLRAKDPAEVVEALRGGG